MATAPLVGLPLFLLIWLGFGAFILYQYLQPMRRHRRGERLAGFIPCCRLRCGLCFEVLGALNVVVSMSWLSVAILRPPMERPEGGIGGDWFESVVKFCQVALLWWRNRLINDLIFAVVAAIGCCLFLHRVVVFAKHGVHVQPFQDGWSFTGQVHWMSRVTGGGWYRDGCDDAVTKAVFRHRGWQLLLDCFLMSSVRFLACTGACAEWGAPLNGGRRHVPFDPDVGCDSPRQFALLLLAAVALLGWYVWVALLIMRMQNHYSQSDLGRSSYPADAYNPFFLIALLQVRILLGILSALMPHPMCIIPACLAASSLLLGLVWWQAPCRFHLVNWMYGLGLAACWTLALVELVVAATRSSEVQAGVEAALGFARRGVNF